MRSLMPTTVVVRVGTDMEMIGYYSLVLKYPQLRLYIADYYGKKNTSELYDLLLGLKLPEEESLRHA